MTGRRKETRDGVCSACCHPTLCVIFSDPDEGGESLFRRGFVVGGGCSDVEAQLLARADVVGGVSSWILTNKTLTDDALQSGRARVRSTSRKL